MMLLPDLFQLCGPCYGSHQNVYALSFPNKQELILFDTGLDETDRKIIGENLSVWGLDAYKISHVFLTHSHFDHTGNAAHRFSCRKRMLLLWKAVLPVRYLIAMASLFLSAPVYKDSPEETK